MPPGPPPHIAAGALGRCLFFKAKAKRTSSAWKRRSLSNWSIVRIIAIGAVGMSRRTKEPYSPELLRWPVVRASSPMRRQAARVAATALFIFVHAACTSESTKTLAVAAQRQASFGVIRLEQQVDTRNAELQSHTDVQIAFANYSGLAKSTLETLLGIDRRLGRDDQCALASNSASAVDMTAARVELADLGRVHVDNGTAEVEVPARAFPEIGGSFIGGVTYTERFETPPLTHGAPELRLRTTGSPQIAAFELSSESPHAPQNVRIDQQLLSANIHLQKRTSTPYLVQWDTAEGLAGDEIELRLSAAGATVVCNATDDGQFSLPADLVEVLRGREECVSLLFGRRRSQTMASADVDFITLQLQSSQSFCVHMD